MYALDQGGTRKRALWRKMTGLTATMFTMVGADMTVGGGKNGFGMQTVEMELPAGDIGPGLGTLIHQSWQVLNTTRQGLGVDAILNFAHCQLMKDDVTGGKQSRGGISKVIEDARNQITGIHRRVEMLRIIAEGIDQQREPEYDAETLKRILRKHDSHRVGNKSDGSFSFSRGMMAAGHIMREIIDGEVDAAKGKEIAMELMCKLSPTYWMMVGTS